MKKLVLIPALVLSMGAPALAQTQLERGVGAAPGQYTLSELAQLKNAATETGADAVVNLAYPSLTFSARNVHSPRAQAIFDRIAAESAEDN